MTVEGTPGDEVGSHVPNQGGWASLEARARERRLAHCLERAATAIDLGQLDDAREALNEARALSPHAPEITELETRIASQPSPADVFVELEPTDPGDVYLAPDLPSPGAVLMASDPPPVEPDHSWRRVIGGTAVLLALCFLLGFGLMQRYYPRLAADLMTAVDPASAPAVDVGSSGRESAALPSAGQSAPSTPVEPSPGTDKPIEVTAPPEEKKNPETAAVAAETRALRSNEGVPDAREKRAQSAGVGTAGTSTRPAPGLGLRLPDPPAAPPPTAPAVEPRRIPGVAEPPTSTSTESTPAPVPSPLPPSAPLPSPASAASSSPSAATSGGIKPVTPISGRPAEDLHAPTSGSRSDEAGIRTALLRYENAYNRLDAKAATAVWPRVDQRALGRAFDGLLSQRVSLGLCDITVIGDVGGASCAGKARWEPKIGGGVQTADRYWTFNLRKSDDGWKIEEIKVR
jgi:hypothetical protein